MINLAIANGWNVNFQLCITEFHQPIWVLYYWSTISISNFARCFNVPDISSFGSIFLELRLNQMTVNIDMRSSSAPDSCAGYATVVVSRTTTISKQSWQSVWGETQALTFSLAWVWRLHSTMSLSVDFFCTLIFCLFCGIENRRGRQGGQATSPPRQL